MDLSKYLKIGLRWWWLILLSVVLSATASYYYSQGQPKIYAAKATLMVGASVVQTINPDENALGLSRTLAQVYGELARRSLITQAVIDRLGLDMSPDQLRKMIDTNTIPSAQLLEIFVLDVHPQRAQLLANTVAEELIIQSPTGSQEQQTREQFIKAQLVELQTKIEGTNRRIEALEDKLINLASAVEISEAQSQLTELENLKGSYQNSYNDFLSNLSESSPNRLTIFEPATEPTQPVAPNVRMNVLIAAAAGLALAIGAILILEFFDDTLVWRREDTQIMPGIPVLGAVSKASKDTGSIVAHNEWSPEAEVLRNLRSTIFLTAADQTPSTLLITSPSANEGKSYVSANLAATIASPGFSVAAVIASGGTKVVLIDADLRKPTLHEMFDIPNLFGLADVLAMPENAMAEVVLKKALKPTDRENLFLLPAGRAPLDPGSLLSSARFSKVLEALRLQADLVIIDSAPVLETVETKAMANVVDLVALVVSDGRTGKKAAQKAIDYFQTMPHNNLLGVIFNRVKSSPSYSYYSAYAHRPQPGQLLAKTTPQPSLLKSILPFSQSPERQTSHLTLGEVAGYLGVSEDTAQRWCEQGRIPAVKTGRRWSVDLEDLNQFIATYQQDGASSSQKLVEAAAIKNGDTR